MDSMHFWWYFSVAASSVGCLLCFIIQVLLALEKQSHATLTSDKSNKPRWINYPIWDVLGEWKKSVTSNSRVPLVDLWMPPWFWKWNDAEIDFCSELTAERVLFHPPPPNNTRRRHRRMISADGCLAGTCTVMACQSSRDPTAASWSISTASLLSVLGHFLASSQLVNFSCEASYLTQMFMEISTVQRWILHPIFFTKCASALVACAWG